MNILVKQDPVVVDAEPLDPGQQIPEGARVFIREGYWTGIYGQRKWVTTALFIEVSSQMAVEVRKKLDKEGYCGPHRVYISNP